MKKLLLATVVSLAVVSIPAFAHHPAADNENMDDDTWLAIDDNLVAVDSPHLDLFLDEDGEIIDMEMGSDGTEPEGESSDGMAQTESGEADSMGREMAGDQTSEGNAGIVPDPEDDEIDRPGDVGDINDYRYQTDQNRPGEVVYGPTELSDTTFTAEVSTSTAINEEGVIKLYKGDRVKIASQLRVAEEDEGQSAQCMVVAQYRKNVGGDEEPVAFMLSDEGWKSWNGSLSDLEGVDCQLRASHRIEAHNDVIPPGEFKLYFGYQLGNGKIVHNPEPLSFRVESTTTD